MRKQFTDAERAAIESFIATRAPSTYPPYVRHYTESQMNTACRRPDADVQMRSA